MSEILSGGCHCGAVQYRVHGPLRGFKHCHCHSCRKINGSAFATSVVADAAAFEIVAGDEALTAYQSSTGKTRHFCGRCGSPIYASHEHDGSFVILRVGTLDRVPDDLELTAHIWTEHQVAWYRIPDNAPHHLRGVALGT